MPTNRRRTKRQRREKLHGMPEEVWQYLSHGWSVGGFTSAQQMPLEVERDLWQQHKDDVMQIWLHPETYAGSHFFKPKGPFSRPSAWWKFETDAGYQSDQKRWLLKHPDLLEECEIQSLEDSICKH